MAHAPTLGQPVRADRAAPHTRIAVNTITLIIIAAALKLLIHTLTNGQYGFHRDELATLDDARYLAWGYVAYPPVTPFIGRIAMELFGPSLVGVRFFAALSQSVVMVLAGLIARELGGSPRAQWIAALALAIAPISIASSTLFMYVAFDYLWWVLIAYFVVRLLKSENPRWWLAIGAVIGLGMMTKYTMGFYTAALAAATLLTPARRYLKSRWLWAGVGLSLLIFLPNLIWQIQHDFISLKFLSSIHARDIEWGRTQSFFVEQLLVPANPLAIPLWIAGLVTLFVGLERRYRLLGWLWVILMTIFVVSQGRSYYTAGAYAVLLVAGAVSLDRWIGSLPDLRARILQSVTYALLLIGGVVAGMLFMPLGAVHSPLFNFAATVNYAAMSEEIGWTDLAEQVADVYYSLPEEERARTGIYAGNYGEAGAINMFGPQYGLPTAIGGANSYWLRGYGDPPPETVIVLGHNRDELLPTFESCEFAGKVTNRYGIENEESTWYDGIFICRGLKIPWPELWPELQTFG